MKIAAGITVSLVLAAAASASTARPTLRLLDANPLTIRGASFKRAELVRIVVSLNGNRHVKRVRASSTGAFTARYDAVALRDPCNDTFYATAVGSGGSRAGLKMPERMCPPALAPGAP